MHYFNRLTVERIAGFVGQSPRGDVATTSGERTRYARACMELNLSKSLLGKYELDNVGYEVVYESSEVICTLCGFFGHLSANYNDAESHKETEMADAPMSSYYLPKNILMMLETGYWVVVPGIANCRLRILPCPPPNLLLQAQGLNLSHNSVLTRQFPS
ncbi:hypothetical protein LINGRAHAP2_LOCUS20514 [Linum grandiflorum]